MLSQEKLDLFGLSGRKAEYSSKPSAATRVPMK
jgi:hypothetical protein